ncbi:MAG: hypothetical protein SFV15_04075 [Polyangiaceae bacterium]|nr:hypothetical protein [Polyangiaceae bacterium]
MPDTERDRAKDPDLESTFVAIGDVLRRTWLLFVRALQFWPAVAVAVLLGAGAAFAAPSILKPIYETSATVGYRETVQASALVGNRHEQERWVQQSARLEDMVLSRTSVTKIIEDLGLYRDIIESRGMADAVEEFRRNVDIVARDGKMLVINFRGSDPDAVQKVGERLVADIIEQPGEYAQEQADATKAFLQKQFNEVAAELRAKEKELATFLTQHPEFALDDVALGRGQVGATIRVAEKKGDKTQGNPRLGELRRQAARLGAQLQDPGAPAAVPAAATLTPEERQQLNDAKAELDRAEGRLDDKRKRFTDRHPDVLDALADVAEARENLAQVNAAISATTSTASPPPSPNAMPAEVQARLETDLRKLDKTIAREARKSDATGKENPGPSAAETVVANETRWVGLNRDVMNAQDRFRDLQRRLDSAVTLAIIEAEGGVGRIVVIDAPLKPTRPLARGPRKTSAMAFAAVLALGCMVAFGFALLDDRLLNQYDLRDLRLGPIAQVIPALNETKKGGSLVG